MQDKSEQRTPVYKVAMWQRGVALYAAGNIVSFFSYAFDGIHASDGALIAAVCDSSRICQAVGRLHNP